MWIIGPRSLASKQHGSALDLRLHVPQIQVPTPVFQVPSQSGIMWLHPRCSRLDQGVPTLGLSRQQWHCGLTCRVTKTCWIPILGICNWSKGDFGHWKREVISWRDLRFIQGQGSLQWPLVELKLRAEATWSPGRADNFVDRFCVQI